MQAYKNHTKLNDRKIYSRILGETSKLPLNPNFSKQLSFSDD